MLAAAERLDAEVTAFAAAAWTLVLSQYTSPGEPVDLFVTDTPGAQYGRRIAVDAKEVATVAAMVGAFDQALRAAADVAVPAADDGSALVRVLAVTDCTEQPGAAHPDRIEVLLRMGAEPALTLGYDRDRLVGDVGASLAGHLRHTLVALATADPDAPVASLCGMPEEDRRRVLFDWNATDVPTEDRATIHELVERRARATPTAPAVVEQGRTVSYAELDAAADAIAATLQQHGCGPGTYVGVHLHRGADAVAALLGVLKAGAAYVPVEVSLPPARVAAILDAVRARVVLTTPGRLGSVLALRPELPHLRHVLLVGENDAGVTATDSWLTVARADAGDGRPQALAGDGDLAYVIFTSGSTGTPKGVVMTHAPVVNVIRWVNETFEVGPRDRLLFVTSLSFDLSVYDIFGILAAGGSIRVASEDELAEPARLLSILDHEDITFWDSAPAMLQQVEQLLPLREPVATSRLRLVFLSGDWVPLSLPDTIRGAFPGAEVVALGGATEAAIWSNFHRVGEVKPNWTSIPYGRPIWNARYYILDDQRRPVSVGMPGNLFIGGNCLAVGYHGDPLLTAKKFVPDPFVGRSDARMYDTGDRARFWADGTIEFLGRRDNQVKVRGFRIELGEIEAVLAEHPDVHTAIAATRGSGENSTLNVYMVPLPVTDPDVGKLRTYLAERLPPYMVPDHVVVIDRVPMTGNGKVDRAALPEPVAPTTAAAGFVAPATIVEMEVARVWCEVLGLDRVSATEDFFQAGGNSLLATRTVARLRHLLDADIPLRGLLRNSVLTDFAAFIEGRQAGQGEGGQT
ncbi:MULTISPECIES: non-ribosomal peptide synthetase [unclassified Micromonospora]|uniref:non-ribosomal peptide synthetase n=1 Tax=unclassified Micromonospora TaxID=2617518 RepID=UPI001104377B